MDLERALETQRDALLRLLAGWLAVVEFVSGGPFAVALPRFMRAFFDSLLIRAELAAHYLLIVSARLEAKRVGVVFKRFGHDTISHFEGPLSDFDGEGDVPSSEALRRRMIALRTLLQNLPGEARRSLQKQSGERAGRPRKATRSARRAHGLARTHYPAARTRRWITPRIERPPDKSLQAI